MAEEFDISNIAKDNRHPKESTTGNARIRSYVKKPGVVVAGICVIILVAAGTATLVYFLTTDDALSASSHEGNITEQLANLQGQASSTTRAPICPVHMQTFQDTCYYFGEDKFDYYRTQEYCRDMDSVMVHINSAEENKYLTDFVSSLVPEFHYWIGIYHDRWSDDNSTVTEGYWGPGEPSSATEPCVAFWVSHEFSWADVRCERDCRPICERNQTFARGGVSL